jgi:hypothetical protein
MHLATRDTPGYLFRYVFFVGRMAMPVREIPGIKP